MLKSLHMKKPLQMILGLLAGIVFGFLLQKGGVTRFEIILGQLLLTDFTVVKIMLSAVVVGMIGVHLLKAMKLANLHPKPGSWNTAIWGGLIFGIGFATLGYCPGTVAGAVGQGSMDALIGGVVGIIAGAGIFAAIYPKMQGFLNRGDFVKMTLPKQFGINEWFIIVPLSAVIVWLLFVIENAGL